MKQIIYKILLAIIMLFISTIAFSQNIAVQSFAPDETDQSARITSKRTDANNKVCALVKIETPLRLQDMTFNAGSVGIVGSKQEVGEIWVWLSPGTQRLTIQHTHLGVVRNYSFPEPLKEASVYVMKLTSGTSTTVINENVALQYLVVNCRIEGATIKIDGNPSEAFNNGNFQKLLSYGTHQYTIDAPMYLPLSGQIEIRASEKTYLTPELQLAFAAITLTGAGDIYVNDEHKGADTWSGRLMPGSYKVEVKKAAHRNSVAAIEVKAGEDKMIPLQDPTPIYGSLNISANAEAAIFIDDVKQKETTPAIIQNVLIGKHEIELQAGGQSEKQSVEVMEGKIAELNVSLQVENSLAREEDAIYSGNAMYSGKLGKLYLFPNKLQFQSDKSNLATIEITQIEKVVLKGIEIAITTTERNTEKFDVNNGKGWKKEIEKLMTARENKVATVLPQNKTEPVVSATLALKEGIIYKSGANYFFSDSAGKMTKNEYKAYLKMNCQYAFGKYHKGESLAKWGRICLWSGLGMIVGGGILLENNDDEDAFAFITIGLASTVTSIPLFIVGSYNKKASVKVYNSNCRSTKRSAASLNFNVKSDGIGLALNF
jgi:hypothetical protein